MLTTWVGVAGASSVAAAGEFVSAGDAAHGIKAVGYPGVVRAAGRLWREIGSGVTVFVGSNRRD